MNAAIILSHYTNGLQSEFAHEVRPSHDELCADGGFDESEHLIVV
jgi:hypothetical protein